MNILSQAPLLTTLVSPVTISTPAAPGSVRHGTGDPAQELDSHALLDDHGAGEKQRDRPADGEIVDRAAHRQLADVAARKDQRVDHEAVGREGKTLNLPRFPASPQHPGQHELPS
jgi:hypothetical protein